MVLLWNYQWPMTLALYLKMSENITPFYNPLLVHHTAGNFAEVFNLNWQFHDSVENCTKLKSANI